VEENKEQRQEQVSSNMQAEAMEFEQRHLSSIPPSYDPRIDVKYYPASVELKDGSRLEKVIFVDRLSARRAICSLDWLESHGTQLWHQVISVDPNAIEYVYRSNSRLPPELVSKTFALYSQKRNFRLFIAKDESPMEVLIGPEHSGLGLFDFPHLPEGYEPNDIVNVVGYDRWSKKNLAGQLKEDKKNKNVPLRILDVVNQDNWRPEKKVYHAHPWEVHYCIYPSIDGVQSTAYADKRYGGNILKRNEMNEEKYHNLQVPINEEKNRARAAILANTQLVQPNQRVQNDDGRFPLPPAIEPEYLDDDIFKNMGTALNGQFLVKVTLKDDSIIDNAIVVHEEAIDGSPQDIFYRCHSFIKASAIKAVEPCENSIPVRLGGERDLDSIYAIQGWVPITAIMNDGSIHACVHNSRFLTFIDLPSPYTVVDIKELSFHDKEIVRYAPGCLVRPIFAVCVIKNGIPSQSTKCWLTSIKCLVRR